MSSDHEDANEVSKSPTQGNEQFDIRPLILHCGTTWKDLISERIDQASLISSLLLEAKCRLERTIQKASKMHKKKIDNISDRISVIERKIMEHAEKFPSAFHSSKNYVKKNPEDLHRMALNFAKIFLNRVTRLVFPRCEIEHLRKGYEQKQINVLEPALIKFRSIRLLETFMKTFVVVLFSLQSDLCNNIILAYFEGKWNQSYGCFEFQGCLKRGSRLWMHNSSCHSARGSSWQHKYFLEAVQSSLVQSFLHKEVSFSYRTL